MEKIIYTEQQSVANITLNQPDIRNAFDDQVIEELIQQLEATKQNPKLRALVISGTGKSFCAGADLKWMKRMKDFDYEANYQDSLALAKMLQLLSDQKIPTIAKVHGAAFGGGVGLVAACDIVVAEESTIFSLSEVRLGLVPACISPYLIRRSVPGLLRRYFLSGERFSASEAQRVGLVNEVTSAEELDAKVDKIIRSLLSCGPAAVQIAKELLADVPNMNAEKYIPHTSEVIAKCRVSDEGQEGLTAFFEKRPARWVPPKN